jgi:hypothetical protein
MGHSSDTYNAPKVTQAHGDGDTPEDIWQGWGKHYPPEPPLPEPLDLCREADREAIARKDAEITRLRDDVDRLHRSMRIVVEQTHQVRAWGLTQSARAAQAETEVARLRKELAEATSLTAETTASTARMAGLLASREYDQYLAGASKSEVENSTQRSTIYHQPDKSDRCGKPEKPESPCNCDAAKSR